MYSMVIDIYEYNIIHLESMHKEYIVYFIECCLLHYIYFVFYLEKTLNYFIVKHVAWESELESANYYINEPMEDIQDHNALLHIPLQSRGDVKVANKRL